MTHFKAKLELRIKSFYEKKSTKSKAKIIYFLYSSQNFVTHENSTDFRMREKYLCIGKACDEKHFRSGRRRETGVRERPKKYAALRKAIEVGLVGLPERALQAGAR